MLKEGTTKAMLKACQGVGGGVVWCCKRSGLYGCVVASILSGCWGEAQRHARDRHVYSQSKEEILRNGYMVPQGSSTEIKKETLEKDR